MEYESKSPSSSSQFVLVGVGFLMGAVLVGACWLSSRIAESARYDIVRNVTVDYMYETAPGSASGSSDLQVNSIEILPGYVVVTDTHGRAQLFALDRLRRFNYWPTEE